MTGPGLIGGGRGTTDPSADSLRRREGGHLSQKESDGKLDLGLLTSKIEKMKFCCLSPSD